MGYDNGRRSSGDITRNPTVASLTFSEFRMKFSLERWHGPPPDKGPTVTRALAFREQLGGTLEPDYRNKIVMWHLNVKCGGDIRFNKSISLVWERESRSGRSTLTHVDSENVRGGGYRENIGRYGDVLGVLDVPFDPKTRNIRMLSQPVFRSYI